MSIWLRISQVQTTRTNRVLSCGMTQLLELELKYFFALRHVVIRLDNQGRVLVVGPNGAGKTALLIEGPYYALFGQSFEYGPRPGDAIGNRFHKTFLTRIDFKSGDYVYRVIRTKGVKECQGMRLQRNGLFLFRQEERHQSRWVDMSMSRASDTQELIDQLVGMTALTFTNTTTFSSDVLRLPDFPDAEKKRIINDLLGVGSCDAALKDTNKRIADINQELVLKESMLAVTNTSVKEASRRVTTLEDSVANWEDEMAHKAQEQAMRKEKLAGELKVKEDSVASLKGKLTVNKAAADACKEKVALIKARLVKLAGISERSKEARPGPGESPAIKQKLDAIKSGACSECKRPFDSNQDPDKHAQHVKKLQKDLTDAIAKENQAMADWKTTDSAVTLRKAQETSALDAEEIDLESHQEAVRKFDRFLAEAEARVFALQEQIDQADEDPPEQRTNPHEKMLEDARSELAEYLKSSETTTEQVRVLKERLANEKVFQELFGNRGCRVNRLDAALPFLNEKCAEVAEQLQTGIQTSFVIRGEGESYANTVEIVVDNPMGAGQYHGNSAGERRLADLVILFSLLSLATASHGAIGQAFFDETFEKLFPSIKNNVMRVIGAVNKQRNSVFIISHVTEGLNLDLIDQIWSVTNGEIEVTSNRG